MNSRIPILSVGVLFAAAPVLAQDAVVLRSSDGSSDVPRLSVTQSVAPAKATVRVDDADLLPGSGALNLGAPASRWSFVYAQVVDTTFSLSTLGSLTVNGNSTLGSTSVNTLALNARLSTDVLPSSTQNLGGAANRWGTVYGDTVNAQSLLSLGTLTVNGNTTLGNASTDTIAFAGQVASSILPAGTQNIGDAADRWGGVFAQSFDASGAVSAGTDLTVLGNASLGNNVAVNTLSLQARLASGLEPNAASTLDLGSSARPWANLFVGTLNVGDSETISDGGTDRLLINAALGSNQTSAQRFSGWGLFVVPSAVVAVQVHPTGNRVYRVASPGSASSRLPLNLPESIYGQPVTLVSVTVHYSVTGSGEIRTTTVETGTSTIVNHSPAITFGTGSYTVPVGTLITDQASLGLATFHGGSGTGNGVLITSVRVNLQY